MENINVDEKFVEFVKNILNESKDPYNIAGMDYDSVNFFEGLNEEDYIHMIIENPVFERIANIPHNAGKSLAEKLKLFLDYVVVMDSQFVQPVTPAEDEECYTEDNDEYDDEECYTSKYESLNNFFAEDVLTPLCNDNEFMKLLKENNNIFSKEVLQSYICNYKELRTKNEQTEKLLELANEKIDKDTKNYDLLNSQYNNLLNALLKSKVFTKFYTSDENKSECVTNFSDFIDKLLNDYYKIAVQNAMTPTKEDNKLEKYPNIDSLNSELLLLLDKLVQYGKLRNNINEEVSKTYPCKAKDIDTIMLFNLYNNACKDVYQALLSKL